MQSVHKYSEHHSQLQLLKSIEEFQTDSAIEKFKEITGVDLREVE